MLTYTNEELKIAVATSFNYSEVLRKLDLSITGSSHKNIQNKILALGFDTSHFCGNKKTIEKMKKHYSEVLIYGGTKNRQHGHILTKRLREYGMTYCCVFCGNDGEWRGKKILLEVDHIDGDWKNNTPENLRFLCPNCHSQTGNFLKKKTHKYCSCGEIIKTKQAKKCKICGQKEHIKNRKVERPSKEILEKLVWQKSSVEIAMEYGVSDTAIVKWCRSYGISKPPRGYWAKQTKRVDK